MSRFFFKINLNKFGELKQQIESERKLFINMCVIFGLGFLVLYGFVLYVNNTLDKKLENRKVYLKSLEDQIKTFQVSGDYLSTKDLERLSKVASNRIFWAKKLVALSEKTNSKIAITHFVFKNEVLSLFGITKVDPGQKEFDLIDEFIAGLKGNQQISGDFSSIQFVKSMRDKEKAIDIIRFQVDCIGKEHGKKKGEKGI